jgi:hypothetical protein
MYEGTKIKEKFPGEFFPKKITAEMETRQKNLVLEQGCQIFLGTKYQKGKNISNYNELH